MKGASIKLQKQWQGFSKPQRLVERILHKDTDRDGVPDRWDCQPRNPKKQEASVVGKVVGFNNNNNNEMNVGFNSIGRPNEISFTNNGNPYNNIGFNVTPIKVQDTIQQKGILSSQDKLPVLNSLPTFSVKQLLAKECQSQYVKPLPGMTQNNRVQVIDVRKKDKIIILR